MPSPAINHGATYIDYAEPFFLTVVDHGRGQVLEFCMLLTVGLLQGGEIAGHATRVETGQCEMLLPGRNPWGLFR